MNFDFIHFLYNFRFFWPSALPSREVLRHRGASYALWWLLRRLLLRPALQHVPATRWRHWGQVPCRVLLPGGFGHPDALQPGYLQPQRGEHQYYGLSAVRLRWILRQLQSDGIYWWVREWSFISLTLRNNNKKHLKTKKLRNIEKYYKRDYLTQQKLKLSMKYFAKQLFF